jgi:hypothetical protein
VPYCKHWKNADVYRPAPTNVAQNTTTSCGKYYNVELGDDCSRVTVAQGISLSDFYFLNPGINENCTNLLAGVSYCVQPVGSSRSSLSCPCDSVGLYIDAC